MKKKFLALIVFLAVALGAIALGSSLGWFPTFGGGGDDPFKSQVIGYGDMEYTLVGGCDIRTAFTDPDILPPNNNKFVAPGENMIYIQDPPASGDWVPGVLTINNKSTVATNLRVKIEYSRWDGAALQTVVYGDETDDFTVDFAVLDDWEYNDATKFWDYSPGDSLVIDAVALDTFPGGNNILINSMGYSKDILVNSNYETRAVNVSLKIEAKQADYVEWSTVSP